MFCSWTWVTYMIVVVEEVQKSEGITIQDNEHDDVT